ncbi:glycosyltransferase family A protein [Candidatus Cyanaurora vandensis]|uniref:glycosyltransferase family 2 protein n=1 Tax=Candidatus Cyanaurora vandensis TaxID=2714958 RepID=UPI00257EF13C|nr:glycosyltransferase family A protein [Candidatus Cyanaurora vandensis]
MPKVSVVIPAYKALAYLPETIASVLTQTFQDFEILVVDDGSPDQTGAWVQAQTDPRIKLFTQVNQGPAAARNTALAQAQGEYVAFLDADDLWEPTKLAKQVQCLDQYPEVGLVDVWVMLADGSGVAKGRVLASQSEGWVYPQLIERNSVGCGSSPMVRRSCLAEVGVFDPNLHGTEDWDLWIRIAAKYPFKVIREPLIRYRQVAVSVSRNVKRMEQEIYKVIEKTYRTVPLELLPLRGKSYGHNYLYGAWQCVASGDYQAGAYLRDRAHAHYPPCKYTVKSWRLGLALGLMQWLKPARYQQLQQSVYELRRLTGGRA